MNRKNFLLLPVMALLTACGQSGELYLPDNLKANQLEQQSQRATTEAQAQQLRTQSEALYQRYQQEQELRAQLSQKQASEQSLRSEGALEAADSALKEVNQLRYRLGQLILQQQTSK
ncbi:MAG: hypothetical protein HON68_08460 [Gammaproteobacteria bacterium]|jgi:predicted small lipoprotein YifL|nr:hypothetical protein [Gammaproteobacteria bacterium]MBT3489011.1 hypothetical protein [Gammaproteobacteria bacterium]MBT3719183.1 hypothetical protein [Gammaproteobacteria bacterium]MBT3845007.1 hypothetical protein [Gammaproteobacteria bacterium]MBT3894275.1 hypothetical protein [Gammaproteobacteria bacterium]